MIAEAQEEANMRHQLTVKEYRDKVQACWMGKNIGGTLGTPFECRRGVWDLDGYTADLSSGALPNDDLDLQLVWLNAAEKYGRSVNGEILGEYWLSYVTPNWSEYGTGKANMARGIRPPYSGSYHNHNKDSCGCFIRSELWACLAPGHPETAVRYAFEDAGCDHGDEGMYAELFCAAVESAAFVEDDRDTLIEVGLSYIPGDCAVARAVTIARECYERGEDWKEARVKILQEVPCSFGMYRGYEDRAFEPEVPAGRLGFDAPANIGIMILGWFYGEKDFGKSLCVAAGCGEDSDCTAATLGSILGIIGGTHALPDKWTDPIGHKVATVSITRADKTINIPDTIDELTQRVCRLLPEFIGADFDWMKGEDAEIYCPQELMAVPRNKGVYARESFLDWLKIRRNGITESSQLCTVTVCVEDGLHVEEGREKKIGIHLENNQNMPLWLTLRWLIPKGWEALPGKESALYLDHAHGGCCVTELTHCIIPGKQKKERYDLVLEISANGRLSRMYVPVTLFCGEDISRCESFDPCRA